MRIAIKHKSARNESTSKVDRKEFEPAFKTAIYVIIAAFTMVLITTILVTEDVKQKLLKVASELQIKLGRRVDLNEALRFLVDQREKNPQLLEEACRPVLELKKQSKNWKGNGNLTKQELKGKLAVDASALIELVLL